MLKTIFISLVSLFGASNFSRQSNDYEQIAFDFFFANIFKDDFNTLKAIEFKGKTEDKFSSIGHYPICLTPTRLQPLIDSTGHGQVIAPKPIKLDHVSFVKFKAFKENSDIAKLYVHHTVRVADNFYVTISVYKSHEFVSNYLFEINNNGEVLRSCKMAEVI